MPHQCTRCGIIFPDASREILIGCGCGSKFFYYIKQERLDQINRTISGEIQDKIEQLDKADKVQIEKDIREITGLDNELDTPVILDLESVKVIKPGKFEIDIVNLFNKKRPLIYKLEEGKYIIDLSSSLKVNKAEVDAKIRDPSGFYQKADPDSENNDSEANNSEEEGEEEDEEAEEEKNENEEEAD
jgi:uncharacterized protein